MQIAITPDDYETLRAIAIKDGDLTVEAMIKRWLADIAADDRDQPVGV